MVKNRKREREEDGRREINRQRKRETCQFAWFDWRG